MSDEQWGYKVTAIFYVQGSQAMAMNVAESIDSNIGGSAIIFAGTKIEVVQDEPLEQGA